MAMQKLEKEADYEVLLNQLIQVD
jgi:isopentenyl-diphosphate Delta-isomerase